MINLVILLCSSFTPQSVVKEDELMSRLEMLENQLQVYSRVSPSTLHALITKLNVMRVCIVYAYTCVCTCRTPLMTS